MKNRLTFADFVFSFAIIVCLLLAAFEAARGAS